jgi:hypothetical protein
MSTSITTRDAELSPRHRFLELLAGNPNYFGNLANSAFQPVDTISSDTEYEQLTCLGFNPDTHRLEAVIAIKQATGYNGSLCQNGSYEYVRFFVDYGAGFEDAGYSAANVHDVPNADDCHGSLEKPLNYAVSVQLSPRTNRCTQPVLPVVRAILSWNAIPTANDPNFTPVWGHALDARIQIKPRALIFKDVIADLTKEATLLVPPEELEQAIKFPIPLPDPAPLTLAELSKLYIAAPVEDRFEAGESDILVPSHRFGFPQLSSALHAYSANFQKIESNIAIWKEVGLDWQQAIAEIAKLSANVSYEQLECVGLEGGYGLERLVANFVIKQPAGYGGGLCTKGSVEYVAFWADWDNTCEYTYLGTVAVAVHDITEILKGGLVYSAALPVDLSSVRRPCQEPLIGRVRAVLSWAVAPSTTNPNALTTWGNIVDAHVQVQPGTQPNLLYPKLSILGGIPTSMIDSSTGLTTSNAAFALTNQPADSYGRACPFGGVVSMQGELFSGYKYQVTVQPVSGGMVQVLSQPLQLTRFDGTTYMSYPDAANFFTYATPDQNIDSLLAEWSSTGDDLWRVTLQIADSSDNPVAGALPDTHVMQLDNTAPQATLVIDNNGDCSRYAVGALVTGHYVAWDLNFGSFSLSSAPYGNVVPANGDTPTAPLPSIGSAWSLDTSLLPPCGYVVELGVTDCSIVDSSPGNHNYTSAPAVGFCLLTSL